MSGFSPDQQAAWDRIDTFVQDDTREFALSGPAGTGKTFLLSRLALASRRWIHKEAYPLSVHWTSTTHKACRVLADMASEEVRTVHSLLGLRPMTDEQQGRRVLKQKRKPTISRGSLIVVDEASMVSQDLLQKLRRAALAANAKILYVGDSYQLAPVGENVSPVFAHVTDQAQLTTVHRQALENPIIAAATDFRAVLDGAPFPRPSTVRLPIRDGDIVARGVVLLNRIGFDKALLRAFEHGVERDDPDFVRFLCWTNANAHAYNRRIRQSLLGTDSDRPQADELMIVNAPVEANGAIVFANEERVWIDQVQNATRWGIEGWELSVANGAIRQRLFLAANPQDVVALRKSYQREAYAGRARCDEEAWKAAWRSYYAIDEHFHDLRPLHAQTVHKSQGSGYRYAFIDMGDIGRSGNREEIARLLYVALTRAEKTAYLTGSLPHHLYQSAA